MDLATLREKPWWRSMSVSNDPDKIREITAILRVSVEGEAWNGELGTFVTVNGLPTGSLNWWVIVVWATLMFSITAIACSKMNLKRSSFGKDSVFRNLEGIPKAVTQETHIDSQQTLSVCRWENT
jgi:hypothetical protein